MITDARENNRICSVILFPMLRRITLIGLLLSCPASGAAAPGVDYLSQAGADLIIHTQQAWGSLGFDTAVRPPDKRIIPLQIKDKHYKRGLGHHANGEILVALDGQYKTFEAQVGVQWQGGNVGSVVFQVFVDDEKRFDSGVMTENDPARKVRVSVEKATDLRLVVTDAGDGITCDCANWVDARLTRDPAAISQSARTTADMAPFARVSTWDPKRMDGALAKRTEEFRAEDLFLGTEVLPADDGTYAVPVSQDGLACIGLEWAERRFIRTLGLEFANPGQVPDVDRVRVQYWKGESAWQGSWKPLQADIEKDAGRLSIRMRYLEGTDAAGGTEKIRWIFPAGTKPIALRRLSAFTNSTWKNADLRVELDRPMIGKEGRIEAYNGAITSPTNAGYPKGCTWDLSKTLQLKVRYARSRFGKTDRTVLRFRLPTGAFGVALEDVLAGDGVYVPHAGVFVTRDPAPMTLADYRKKIADRKTVLQRVRAMPDQTFAQAWDKVHNPIQDNGPTMLSLACDNRKFVAFRNGRIEFDAYSGHDDPVVPMPRTYALQPRFGSEDTGQITRHLHGGWFPIPVIETRQGSVSYQQRTCVVPLGDEPISGSNGWLYKKTLCLAEYILENHGTEESGASIFLDLRKNSKTGDSQALTMERIANGVIVSTSAGKLLAYVDASEAEGFDLSSKDGTIALKGSLKAGAKICCSVYLPAWDLATKQYAELQSGRDGVEKCKAYWNRIMGSAIQIEVPDPFLNNIIRASQVHCLLAARNEDRGSRVAAWVGSDRYGPLESETHSVIRGMDMMGQHEFARRSLEYQIKRYNQAGYLTTGYTIMGTGWHLWTLAEHYERTKDRDWFKKVAPEVARVCKWIVRQREKTERFDARNEKVPEYGLVPPGVAADWNRYAYRFVAEAHYFAGLEGAARALADIDYPDAADLLKEAEAFREDIRRAYQWVQTKSPVLPLANGTWIPAYPGMLYCFGRIEDIIPGEDGNRSWCYDVELGAHHLVVNDVLDAHSSQAAWIADHMEDVWFLHDGMGDYRAKKNRQDFFNRGGFSKVQPYYTRNAELYALRDDVKPFIRSYFNTVPSLLSKENLSFWEHFHNIGGWNKTHETGYFLAQTHLMLVMDRDDELWLAPFVTNNWMKDGMKIAVRSAPTRFGKVGYTITSSIDRGFIEAVVQPPTRTAPNQIVIRLRHPNGKRMKFVTVNGKPHKEFDPEKEIIRIKPEGDPITVRAKF